MNNNDVVGVSLYNSVLADLKEAEAKAAEYLRALTLSQGKLLRAEKRIEELEQELEDKVARWSDSP